MRKRTFKLYRKIYPKSRLFAREQYVTDGYEREWLSKGYYHGYVNGAKAMYKRIGNLMGKDTADRLLDLVLGEPKIIK